MPDDCWVSFYGDIYDITKLIKENEGPLTAPLLRVAGSDISHWFDCSTVDEKKRIALKTAVDPVTNLRGPYVPNGRFVHVPPNDPSVDWDSTVTEPWWQDQSLIVGFVSTNVRKIRIKNVLTRQEHLLEVPGEETLEQIRLRYAEYNWHAESYAWKVLRRVDACDANDLGKNTKSSELKFVEVDLSKTLEENGVVDDTKTLEELSIPSDAAIPVIHLYFKDDLTVA